MSRIDRSYQELLTDIVEEGKLINGRNGPILTLHNVIMDYFHAPIISLRAMPWRQVLGELQAFMDGCELQSEFEERGCKYWAPWATPEGLLGPIYDGFRGTEDLIQSIIHNPYSRRHVIYNSPSKGQVLPPCHISCCVNVQPVDLGLVGLVTMRSCDMVVGYPADIFLYWAYLTYLGLRTGYRVKQLTIVMANAHIYKEHMPVVSKMLSVLNAQDYPEPTLSCNSTNLLDWSISDYNPILTEVVKAPV